MPTYEYKCSHCDYTFEKFQSITAKPIRRCPRCGRSKVQRLIGCGAGLIFKGNGFYQTDYRSSSYQKAAQADKEKTSSAAATGAAKASGGETQTKRAGSGAKTTPDAS